jgi:hypothetical protein
MGFVAHGETFSSDIFSLQSGKLMTFNAKTRDPLAIALLTPLIDGSTAYRGQTFSLTASNFCPSMARALQY